MASKEISSEEKSDNTLRIQIASDLHLEFYSQNDPPRFTDILVPDAPVLALLGDISVISDPIALEHYERFLTEAAGIFERILILLGNHEFYTQRRIPTSELVGSLREMCGRVNPITISILENNSVVINNVRVTGCVLWSKIHKHHTVLGAQKAGRDPCKTAEFMMNDFRQIYTACHDDKRRCITADDTNNWHAKSLLFLEKEARAATAARQRLLILTHHAPSFLVTSESHQAEAVREAAFIAHLMWYEVA